MSYKLIILDRDGVINYDSDDYIKSIEEFKFIPKSIDAICKLSSLGYKVAIATNQSGIFRQYYTLSTLELMHKKLLTTVKSKGGNIDKILFCPHGPDENCQCRKPKPGMLCQLIKHFKIKSEETIMVGDSVKDLQAAEKIGITTVLVKTGKGLRSLESINKNPELLKNKFHIFNDLYHFTQNIKTF